MHDLYPPNRSAQKAVPMGRYGRPRPMTWRQVVELLEDVDRALVREGRRPSPGEEGAWAIAGWKPLAPRLPRGRRREP